MRKKGIVFILVIALLLPIFSSCGRGNSHVYTPTHDLSESIAGGRVFSPTTIELGMEAENSSPIQAMSFSEFNFTDDEIVPRDGYVLVPTMLGATGIDTLSSFFLRTPYNIGDNMPILTIDGQPAPIITQEDNTTFLVTPALPLRANAVYVFRLSRDNHGSQDSQDNQKDITWAFQTTTRFEIMSTLPHNQSTFVPVRTSIEIQFSQGTFDIETMENYFTIYPEVSGRFINQGNTAIFMPLTPLAHEQIYTVTISANIHESFTEDFTFAFETESVAEQTFADAFYWFNFNESYVEFPTFEIPQIAFWLNYDTWRRPNATRPTLDIGIYQFTSNEQVIEAVNQLTNFPWWSFFARDDRFVDTSLLTQLESFRITEPQRDSNDWWGETLTVPNSLPHGFYLINATIAGGEVRDQVIIQITDTAVQVVADDSKILLWVHDMITGLPAGGYGVRAGSETTTVSDYGIAVVNSDVSTIIITDANGIESFVFPNAIQAFSPWVSDPMESSNIWNPWGWDAPISRSFSFSSWMPMPVLNMNSQYWSVLQLDRTLFQRSDTINLWGFAQNRTIPENITHVTASIRMSWGSTMMFFSQGTGTDILHQQTIPVIDGAFVGEINLPNLDPAHYSIIISHGDIILDSKAFEVRDYAKPPYQLVVTADRVAAFANEELRFSARTEFFEGTPVPDLRLNYNIFGNQMYTSYFGDTQTDSTGLFEITNTPVFRADAQGQDRITFSADATLPEIGWVHQQATTRVFINDINVDFSAHHTGDGNATLDINVHNITLDRLNNGTAENSRDFLCSPVLNQSLEVAIVRYYWVRIREGERFDSLTRQVIPRYRHERREEILQTFTLTTDSDGFVSRDFTIPYIPRESFVARITTVDGNGRTIRHTAWIGRDFSSFHNNANSNRLFLEGIRPASEGYNIGDEVEVLLMRGDEQVSTGNVLFLLVHNDIIKYQVGSSSLNFTFEELHAPNTAVFAYHFNGHVFSQPIAQRVNFNRNSRELVLDINICSDSYQPGETATITVTARDLQGNPKSTHVNISLVDEALFALVDYDINTLDMLYRRVNDTVRLSGRTHRTFVSDGLDEDDVFWEFAETESYAGGPQSARAALATPAPVMAPNIRWSMDSAMVGGGGGVAETIREIFEDTAVFLSLQTGVDGVATFTFQLPHNITSWRVTASGVTNNLYAGNVTENVIVSLPMFVHYTLNSVFLVGDTPSIGVNAYGTSLTGGEQVTFEVWCESQPNHIFTATGASFERVNIPLWELTTEGNFSIYIRATVGGRRDTVRHDFQVLNSHRQVDIARFYNDITPGTAFEIGQQGMTNITFTDQGSGQFLNALLSMGWTRGARIEGLVAQRESTRLIERFFPDTRMFNHMTSFDVRDYQVQSGGIAWLPYSDANLETTVKLMPFILDEINIPALSRYLNRIKDGESSENRIIALYGLAMLGEPVLLDLQRYLMLDDLSVENLAYIALGLIALGEVHIANFVFDTRITPYLQRITPYYRVNSGRNNAEIQQTTATVALLAAQLGLPQALPLHNYALRRFSCDFSKRLEQLAFISFIIEDFNPEPASLTYTLFGEERTIELNNHSHFTLRIPTQNKDEFNITSVTGAVGAVSIIRTAMEDIEPVDTDITITRTFIRERNNTPTTTFEQGDLVRVEIRVVYSGSDIEGSYIITDFLPAGLVLVEGSARVRAPERYSHNRHLAHASPEGQRVTFFDFNSRFFGPRVYFYYARVVNPGVFTAEGTLIQSIGAMEYIAIGDNATITILD